LLIVDILDHFVLSDISEGDLYLAEIAIDPSLRGQGIGRKVISDVIDYARSKGYKRVTIDADFRNSGAKSLYESIGFRNFDKKQVKIGSFVRGMYNMEFNL
jgi:ribosomal protein S18 acetylase RimI-like enzyme